jgi:hypothetical protein
MPVMTVQGLFRRRDRGLPMTWIRREWRTWLNLAVCVLVSIVGLLTIHDLLIRVTFLVLLMLVAAGGALLVLAFRRNAQAGIPPIQGPKRPGVQVVIVVYEILLLIGVIRYFAH